MNKIICLGSATWDQTLVFDSLNPEVGRAFANGFLSSGGGIASNAAVAMCGDDCQSIFIGRVGSDTIGKQITEDLTKHGVDISHCLTYDHVQSSMATIILDRNNGPRIYVYKDPNMPKSTSSILSLDFSDVSAVVADLTWIEGATLLFDRARKFGIPTFLRINFYEPKLDTVLKLTDYQVFDRPSLAVVSGKINYRESLNKVHKQFGATPIVTLGARGCAWKSESGYKRIYANKVNVVDTTGAGDIFTGLLAKYISAGDSIQNSLEKATELASLSCEHIGTRCLHLCNQ